MNINVPWHLSGVPYEVQSTACSAAALMSGFAYFLEQGLGKTAVILNEITDLHWREEIDVAVIWMPKTLMWNWVGEARKLGFKGTIFPWTDKGWPSDAEIEKALKVGPVVLLMNFEALITDRGETALERVFNKYAKRLYAAIDESSRIKNPTAKRTKKALMWGAMAAYKRIATGTPITQNVGDLWAQLKFIGVVKNRFFPFRNRFAKMGGYMGRQIVGVEDEAGLQALMDGNVMIAKKRDWTDLPEKQYVLHDVPLAPVQNRAYKEMVEELVTTVDATIIEATLALTMMGKLQQITSGFINDNDGKHVPLFKNPEDIPVIAHWLDVRSESSKKQITFVTNIYTLEMVEGILRSEGGDPVVIRGGQKPEFRQAEIDRFNEDPTCRDAVVQIQAGGIGVTLLGTPGDDRCSVTHWLENTFSLEARLQGEDRNHRHGQDEMVTHHDYGGAPIHKTCIEALQRKDNLANSVQNPLLWKPQ